MYAFLLAATLTPAPGLPAATEMAPLFRAQQVAAVRDIRIEIQADLEHRGARFFQRDGELRQLLRETVVADTGLAAR